MMGLGAFFASVRVMWSSFLVFVRVVRWILPLLIRVMWPIFSIGSAYVDWFQLGSMDFEFNWGTDKQSCGVIDIISNLSEILLDPNVGTLREIHAKCVSKKGNYENVPMYILKKIELPLELILAHMGLRVKWVWFVLRTLYKMYKHPSLVSWIKTCFGGFGVQFGVECVKACFGGFGVQSGVECVKACLCVVQSGVACVKKCLCVVQSGVACVKKCFRSDGVQSKLSDEDFDKIIRRLHKGLHMPSHAFDERIRKKMSDLLLCIPDYAIGTRWGIRMASEEDSQKGVELKDPKLLHTVQCKMHFSAKEWSTHCTEKITRDHYLRYEMFVYYPMPFEFGRQDDLKSILNALKDAAFRVELEKEPDLCRDILALHA